ncbi:MAG: corrinoid protein [Candidatus Geothermincolia bacterium]
MEDLAALICEIRDEETLAAVDRALAEQQDPMTLIESLRAGMNTVGERFESKEYFLPELVMAAELFKQAVAKIEPHLGQGADRSKGTVIIGTVQGDIHDIGKNLVATILRCQGYEVHDLGVDVSADAFVSKARETGAKVVAMSGLLTLAFDAMKRTIEVFQEAGMRDQVKVLIGGGPVNDKVLDFAGADAWGKDPTDALRYVAGVMGQA